MIGRLPISSILVMIYFGLLAMISYEVSRSDFFIFFGLYSLLFGAYVIICRRLVAGKFSLKLLLFLAIIARLMVSFDMPSLSDDVYRFLWDGQLVVNGENPYALTPKDIFLENNFSEKQESLFPMLNSPEYHSVYPPSNQVLFALAAWCGDSLWEQVAVLRVILLLFECWTIYLLVSILRITKKPFQWVWWYALNPLVVLEIMGNLHFEGMMLPFLLLGIRALLQKRDFKAGAALGIAVGVKLSPLILLPLILKQTGGKRFLRIALGFSLAFLLAFAPLIWDKAYIGFYQSLGLYYGRFEFNAFIYYLLRELGYWWEGYNTIALLGKGMAILTFLIITGYSLLSRGQMFSAFLKKLSTIYLIYLLLSLVVHPWYLIPLLALGILSGQYYPLVWSFVIMLSYLTYQTPAYEESWIAIGIEYILLFTAIYFEKYLHLLPKTFNFK